MISAFDRKLGQVTRQRPQAPDFIHEPPEWTKAAACQSVDPELWYPEKGGNVDPAKRICVDCEARVECAIYGLEHHERFGIWGGLSERERRALLSRGWKPGDPVPMGTIRYEDGAA